MNRKLVSRFALSALIAMTACVNLKAQTPAPSAPVITLSQADGQTVHQSAGMVLMQMNAADPVGLRSAAFSGAYSSGSSQYANAPKSATLCLYFYVGYFPAGDYTFHATAVNTTGAQTDKYITIHLVP